MIEHVFTGSAMERDYGHCRAAVVDGWIFVSGTAGNDKASGTFPESVEAQTALMLDNPERALKAAGSGWEDVVKRTVYLPNPKGHEGGLRDPVRAHKAPGDAGEPGFRGDLPRSSSQGRDDAHGSQGRRRPGCGAGVNRYNLEGQRC